MFRLSVLLLALTLPLSTALPLDSAFAHGDDSEFQLPWRVKKMLKKQAIRERISRKRFAWAQQREIERDNREVEATTKQLLSLPESVPAPEPHLAAGRVRPGGLIALWGDFGERPGFLQLRTEPCDDDGRVFGLEVIVWDEHVILAQVPADTAGITGSPAGVEVRSGDEQLIAAVDVEFLPLMELRTLHWTDPAVHVVTCVLPNGFNSCNGSGGPISDDGDASSWSVKILAEPEDFFFQWGGFSISLANGWSFFSVATNQTPNMDGPVPAFPDYDLPIWNPGFVHTFEGFPGETAYQFAWVRIIGPVGVSHNF